MAHLSPFTMPVTSDLSSFVFFTMDAMQRVGLVYGATSRRMNGRQIYWRLAGKDYAMLGSKRSDVAIIDAVLGPGSVVGLPLN